MSVPTIPTGPPWAYPVYREQASIRDPEWEPIEFGYSHQGEGRQFFWDPIHGAVMVTGPVIEYKPPIRPK